MLSTLVRAVEQSNDVFLIAEAEPRDEPGQRIVYVNPAFERMTGYTAEDVLGKTPRLLQGPKTCAAATHRIREASQRWQPIREELVNYRKDGSEFVVELSIVPIANEFGWFTHWLSIQRDVTEHSALRNQIAESDRRLRRILAAVPQLIWTADARAEVDWVSDSFAEFLGVTPADCLGGRGLQFVHPADHGKAIAMRANALAAPQTYSCELRLRRHDGRYVWFLNRAVPELQADGTVECWIGSLTDISQQKDAELELRASEQRLRLGLGVARVAISEIDYIEEVHRLSAEMAALFGFGEEAVTLPREVVRHRLHPEDRELLDARNAATLLEGAPAWFELDHRLLLPDGKTRCIRIRKLNLIEGQGAHKRKTGSIMAAFDITDSKAAEAALKQTAEMLRLGVGVARLGLLDIDYGASSIHLSDEAARMYGLGEEATTVPAEVVHRRTHPDDLVELIRRSDALTPARSNWLEIEYRILLPQGGTRWVRAWKTVQFDGEGPTARAVRAIVAFLDVTDGRRAEQGAREAARRFRELAGGIAHDFNNLLTSVLLHASLAERAAKEPEVKRSLQTILQAAQTAAGITSGLVTLSERPTPPTEAVDINQRVKRVVQLSEPTLRPDVEVVLQLAEGEVRVLMNAAQCDQIVLNLVINAREAMPSGGRLTIATAVIERPGIGTTEPARCARLTVADTGPGMPAEAMQHIFEPYFTTKRNSGGRGLGLAILDAIVTNHGGKVSVQSTAVTGTCFEVLLPCLESAAPDSAPASETGTEPVSHGLRTILLAEDDEKIRDVLQQLLSRQGFYVLACADGQHALELAEGLQGKIDLLISDIRMPRMDGVSLAHTLVQTRPDLKVLLISGHLGDSNISLQAVRPEWTLLRKPFQLQDFLQKIVGLMNASAIGPESSPGIDS